MTMSISTQANCLGKLSIPFVPGFKRPLHVGYPNVSNKDAFLTRIEEVLERNWLSNDGPLLQEFEQRIASMVGVQHCVAMCNGTLALEIALRALGVKGEVVIPAYTFVATAHALKWQGIEPIFCDIEPGSHNINPDLVERCITPRTSAILAVHLWGRPCAIEALKEVADRHGLSLIFDAAHAFGNSHNGRMIGQFGNCEIFSFHATKFVHSCEGGAVVTNDGDLAAKMRLMRNFGFQGYDRVSYLGTNAKMSEIAAAMGLTSLENMRSQIEINRRNYDAYQEMLQNVPGISLLSESSKEQRNFQYVVMELQPEEYSLTRDQCVQVLHMHNVLARRYFFPGVHQMEPYLTERSKGGYALPCTEVVMNRVIVMPTGNQVTTEMINQIGTILAWANEHSSELGDVLPAFVEPGGTFQMSEDLH